MGWGYSFGLSSERGWLRCCRKRGFVFCFIAASLFALSIDVPACYTIRLWCSFAFGILH